MNKIPFIYKTLLFLAALMFFGIPGTSAHAANGKNTLMRGDSSLSLGRGATGVASSGTNFFIINPASIAALERFEFSVNYGTLDGAYMNPGIYTAMPTSYGVFGASFRSLSLDQSRYFEKGYQVSAGGAKNFTEHLVMGAAINLFYGSTPADRLYNTALSLGAIYTPGFAWNFSHGFGIFDPSLGSAIQAGLSAGDRKNSSDFNQLTLGYQLLFYRHPLYTVGLFNDASFFNGYEDYRVKFGLETEFYRYYSVRAGVISPGHHDYSGWTMGAGCRLVLTDFEGRLDYSLIYQGRSEIFHYLGLTVKYGELDRSSPAAGISPTERYISPNYDGRQDFVVFNITVTDQSRIKGWRFQVLNAAGDVVREYRLSDRDIEERLTPVTFIKRIWQRKESITVPESILWDGTDSRGKIVPDGRYTFSFLVWDEHDNISTMKTGAVYVDNTPPAVELKSDDILFSPNGDKQKDTLVIFQQVSTAPDDQWHAGFTDASGITVKNYNWAGGEVPAKLIWDGRDDAGNEPAEGIYSYFIESTDRAGNSVKKTIKGITLTRHYETADSIASREYFSPPLHREIRFFLALSRTVGLEEWTVTIEDGQRKPVKRFTGGAVLEKFITWDGRDSAGRALQDGRYYYRLNTRFASGNIPSSFEKELVIDGTPPELSIHFSPSLFSPDGDGSDDLLSIRPGAKDSFGIANWNINIYTSSGVVFKTFQGTSAPAPEIIWDGINESGELVESAVDYFIELEAYDSAGNYARTERLRIPIDVLVIVTDRGLKIRISNIEFAFNSAVLTSKASPVLGRVATILSRYGGYSILIEGHTDDIGEEEYNLTLSEQRAKSVMDYLITKGIEKNRLSFRGMGESSPFLPNTSEENRRRNRRVEFILIKNAAP